jgi:Positive regulator of sigma E activity
MTQNGVVTKLLDKHTAEVSVTRGTACGRNDGHCASCEACVYSSQLFVKAANNIYAKPGERVVIESRTASIMGATLLIYLLPLIVFFAAYAAALLLGAAQSTCMWISLVGLAAGILAAVLIGRSKKEITFEITGYPR